MKSNRWRARALTASVSWDNFRTKGRMKCKRDVILGEFHRLIWNYHMLLSAVMIKRLCYVLQYIKYLGGTYYSLRLLQEIPHLTNSWTDPFVVVGFQWQAGSSAPEGASGGGPDLAIYVLPATYWTSGWVGNLPRRGQHRSSSSLRILIRSPSSWPQRMLHALHFFRLFSKGTLFLKVW